MSEGLSPKEKALEVNRDERKYGSFAEIGAGQEVARWFFRAGRASGTIAKTISAYDKGFSDSIYGPEENHRYVCENRLLKMLDREYGLLEKRLSDTRGKDSEFFAFADTVASKRLTRPNDAGHGWMGVRFQTEPLAKPSQVIIHVRMMDETVLAQQEVVGLLGVNLIHGCCFDHGDPLKLMENLKDGLKSAHFEIDMIQFDGPAFSEVDNRLMSLYLVQLGLTDAALFGPDGSPLQPSDALYKRHLVVQRGRFRPITKLHMDMLQSGVKEFLRVEPDIKEDELLPVMEITINNLLFEGKIDIQDFLSRVDLLCSLGCYVMISNYAEYYRLSEFFSKYTREKVGIVMGVGHLNHIFDERFYENLPGGLLESLGVLFSKNVRTLVYPAHSLSTTMPSPKDSDDKLKPIRAIDFEPAPDLKHLYEHMLANRRILDVSEFNDEFLKINSEVVLSDIRAGNESWKPHVPDALVQLIEKEARFGYGSAKKKSA